MEISKVRVIRVERAKATERRETRRLTDKELDLPLLSFWQLISDVVNRDLISSIIHDSNWDN